MLFGTTRWMRKKYFSSDSIKICHDRHNHYSQIRIHAREITDLSIVKERYTNTTFHHFSPIYFSNTFANQIIIPRNLVFISCEEISKDRQTENNQVLGIKRFTIFQCTKKKKPSSRSSLLWNEFQKKKKEKKKKGITRINSSRSRCIDRRGIGLHIGGGIAWNRWRNERGEGGEVTSIEVPLGGNDSSAVNRSVIILSRVTLAHKSSPFPRAG